MVRIQKRNRLRWLPLAGLIAFLGGLDPVLDTSATGTWPQTFGPSTAQAHPGHVRPGGLYVAFKIEADRIRGGLNLPADQLARATGEAEALTGDSVPDVATLTRLRDNLRALPAALAPVQVDGMAVTPVVERVDLLLRVPPPALYGVADVPGLHLSPSPFPAAQVRFSLPIQRPPTRIDVRWTRPDWLATAPGSGPSGPASPLGARGGAAANGGEAPFAGGGAANALDTAVAGTVISTEETPFHLTAAEPTFTWHAKVEVPEPQADVSARPRLPRRWPVWPAALGVFGLLLALVLRRRPAAALSVLVVAGAGAFLLRDSERFGVAIRALDAGGRPTDAEARRIFEARLRAVYQAFAVPEATHPSRATTSAAPENGGDRRADRGAGPAVGAAAPDSGVRDSAASPTGLVRAQDAAVYDALAQAVDGPLLDWMYRQVFETLVQRENGGAVAQLEAVEVLSATITDPPSGDADDAAFAVAARWRVVGEVRHHDHAHRRAFELVGEYVLAPREAGYRIVALKVTEQTRIDTEVPTGLIDAP